MEASHAPATAAIPSAVATTAAVLCPGLSASAAAAVVEPPAAALAAHRVQLSVRGQRFEMALGTALDYCVAFCAFFRSPVDVAAAVTAASITAADATLLGPAADVWALSALPAEAAGARDRMLLSHYTTAALPLLAATITGGGGATPLPPLAAPESVDVDGATGLWRFVFPRRLPEDVAAAEQARLDAVKDDAKKRANEAHQRLADKRHQQQQQQPETAVDSSGLPAKAAPPQRGFGQIYSLEPNANPFLLPQPHFLGIILVLMRRAGKLLAESHATAAAAGGGEAAAPPVASPAFPARWEELDYDAQLSLSQLVRSLGVSLLLKSFAVPTASIETSDFYDRGDAMMAVEAGEKDHQAPTQQQQQEEHGDMAETDAHLVDKAWVRQGCAACGMSGHPTEQCPYSTKE